MYASSWFMTLFAGELPLPVSERIMDILLLDGPATLFRVALAVLKRSHDRLLLMPFEELVPALRSDLYSAFSGPDDLVADVRRSPVTDKKLAKLEKAFIAERQRVAAAAAAAAAGGEGDADRVRRLEAQLERANAQNAMLQEEVSAHRKTLSNLSLALGVQREAAAAAAAAAAAEVAEKSPLNADSPDDESGERRARELTAAVIDPAALLDENEVLRRQVARLREENADLAGQVTALERDLAESKVRTAEMAGELDMVMLNRKRGG